MFARVTTLQSPPDSADQARTTIQQQVLPAVRQIKGFRGLLSLADLASGKAMTITLWESEEAMRASEDAANTLRTTSAASAGGEIVSVDRLEVIADTVSAVTV